MLGSSARPTRSRRSKFDLDQAVCAEGPPRIGTSGRPRPLSRPLGGDRSGTVVGVTREEIADLVHLRRARDLIDRDYAQPLDVPAVARTVLMSPAHFSREFRAALARRTTPIS